MANSAATLARASHLDQKELSNTTLVRLFTWVQSRLCSSLAVLAGGMVNWTADLARGKSRVTLATVFQRHAASLSTLLSRYVAICSLSSTRGLDSRSTFFQELAMILVLQPLAERVGLCFATEATLAEFPKPNCNTEPKRCCTPGTHNANGYKYAKLSKVSGWPRASGATLAASAMLSSAPMSDNTWRRCRLAFRAFADLGPCVLKPHLVDSRLSRASKRHPARAQGCNRQPLLVHHQIGH